MAQFQAHIPDPLAQDLPALLSQRRITTPAIGALFLILISKSSFKGAAMQMASKQSQQLPNL
jgi:hypothetical protein